MFGRLMTHRDAADLRAATAAELQASLEASLYDGGVGAFNGPDGVACYVTGETAEGRAEALALPVAEVAEWPPRGEARDAVREHVGRMRRRGAQ